MSIFRVGRGDFLGIFIPGAFLVAHLIYAGRGIDLIPIDESSLFGVSIDSVVVLPLLFVVAYITGFMLRLIKPAKLEYIGLIVRRKSLSVAYHPYGYISWMFDEYLAKGAKDSNDFYITLLNNQFNGDRKRLMGIWFLNHCKLYVIHNSSSLRDEVIQSEGLVRFVAGMAAAFMFSISI